MSYLSYELDSEIVLRKAVESNLSRRVEFNPALHVNYRCLDESRGYIYPTNAFLTNLCNLIVTYFTIYFWF